MRRTIARSLGFAMVLVLAVACGGATSSEQQPSPVGYTATDVRGKTITLDHAATKVVCLHGSTCWGLLSSLGIVPIASTNGLDDMKVPAYFGDKATQIPLVVWNSVEDVAKTHPDLIVARQGNDDLAKAMEAVAPVFLADSTKVSGVVAALKGLGQLTGRTKQANSAIARFNKFVSGLKGKVAGTPKTVAIQEAWLDKGYQLLHNTSPVCDLLQQNTLATCPFAPPSGFALGAYPESEFASSAVLVANPSLIALIGYPGAPKYQDRKDPVWGQLSAVKDGMVFQDDVSYTLYGQSLQGLEFATQNILSRLYPDKFSGPGDWTQWVPPGDKTSELATAGG
jgi:ABC-type Fe3+-hydroxamate transport system substrate-binding protein